MKNLIKIRKKKVVKLKMMTFILTLMNHNTRLKKKKKYSMEATRKKEKLKLLDQLHQESIKKIRKK